MHLINDEYSAAGLWSHCFLSWPWRGFRDFQNRSLSMKFFRFLAFALALMLPASVALAQEGAVSASERLAQPGEKHAWLEPLIGNWSVEMLIYPGPGNAPIVIPGMSAKREWILGKRYLREELRGATADKPVMRVGTMGFNRLENRFELVTVDAYEPGQMIYAGREDAQPNSISVYGESTEAGMGKEPTGRKRSLRFAFEIASKDANIQKIFVRYPGGEEFLFVEQRFTRVP
jgi:hypothetical protein